MAETLTAEDVRDRLLALALRARVQQRLAQISPEGAQWEVQISRDGGEAADYYAIAKMLPGGAGPTERFEALADDPFVAVDGALEAAQIWLAGAAAPPGELPA